jgi:YVTN family beta-propeller protein
VYLKVRVVLIAIRFFAAFCFSYLFLLPLAHATRLPVEARKSALQIFVQGTVRLDGSVKMPDGSIILPLMPTANTPKRNKNEGSLKYPVGSENPEIVFYENNWGHIRTIKKDRLLTLPLPNDLPEAIRKYLLTMKFPSDLIVPDGFVLPKSLKPMAADLDITLAEDIALAKPDLSPKRAESKAYHGPGIYALTSLSKGSIIFVDGKSFAKLAEFPTEGTPCGMNFVDGRIYIADQAKNRILLLDPNKRKFLGQIDLTAGCAPKGIASLPNGRLVYVSESANSSVAVMETATGKVLVRTKVPTGPGRLMITADGVYLVVLSVTAGELSVISTYNQKLIGTVKVGSVPTAVVISKKDKLAYVSNRMSNTVSVVDLGKRQIVGTIKTGVSPTGLALNNDESKLYVAQGRDNTIGVFSCKTLAKLQDIKLPLDVDFPLSLCLSPDGKQLIVSSQQTDMIGVLDTEKLDFAKVVSIGKPTHEVIWIPAN